MNYFRKKILEWKLNSEDYLLYKELSKHYRQCLRIEEKLSEYERSDFSMAYLAISYEYFLLGFNDIALESIRRVRKIQFLNLYEKMLIEDNYLAVGLIVFDKIKDLPEFKDNFYFKIFEGKLKSGEIKFPYKNNTLLFPEFVDAWAENINSSIN